MTNQEAFDKVAIHLLTQNAKCLGGVDGDCPAYYNEKDQRCAIGCLITKEEADEIGLCTVIGRVLDLPASLSGLDLKVLGHLQDTHDQVQVHNWQKQLRYVAEVFMLDTSVLDQFEWSNCRWERKGV